MSEQRVGCAVAGEPRSRRGTGALPASALGVWSMAAFATVLVLVTVAVLIS